jgi:hypothetical protein
MQKFFPLSNPGSTLPSSGCRDFRPGFLALALAVGLILLALAQGVTAARQCTSPVTGTVWQLDNATVRPDGSWEKLGARSLLIQWSAVGDLAFIPDSGLLTYDALPDWERIAAEPWASEVILGLAGYFDENMARANLDKLTEQSLLLAQAPTPLNVTGWYFPVEVDPTWTDAPSLVPFLNQLPHPLWISVYDSANVGAEPLAHWLESWLPKDVGIFFQDGVGLYVRTPEVAHHYVDVLGNHLGSRRVRVIVEAFRPMPGGGFRAATVGELAPQVTAYPGHKLYLFDGPHYVSDSLVNALVLRWCPTR